MYGYIYKTTNLITNKIYIGQKKSSKFLEERYLGSGKRLWEAIRKYGKENFKVDLLEKIEDESLMDVREIFWINYYNSTNKDIGYNLSEGGNVNRTLRGENNGFYGKHHSLESLLKMKEAHKNRIYRKHTEEEKIKIGLGNKGKLVSETTKMKLKENAKINPNYGMRGKKMSEEAKRKMIETRKINNPGESKIKNRIHITNDIESKMINLDELDYYLNLGWRKGRKKWK